METFTFTADGYTVTVQAPSLFRACKLAAEQIVRLKHNS